MDSKALGVTVAGIAVLVVCVASIALLSTRGDSVEVPMENAPAPPPAPVTPSLATGETYGVLGVAVFREEPDATPTRTLFKGAAFTVLDVNQDSKPPVYRIEYPPGSGKVLWISEGEFLASDFEPLNVLVARRNELEAIKLQQEQEAAARRKEEQDARDAEWSAAVNAEIARSRAEVAARNQQPSVSEPNAPSATVGSRGSGVPLKKGMVVDVPGPVGTSRRGVVTSAGRSGVTIKHPKGSRVSETHIVIP